MSLSWIERARRRFDPKVSAGLVIGRNYLGLTELVREGEVWRVAAVEEAALDVSLYTGAPTPATTAAVVGTLERIARRLPTRYLPVHVSLPDAAVRLTTFELQELPKKHRAQVDLVEFRFARQAGAVPSMFACEFLGSDNGMHLLLGLATDKAWLQWINEVLAQAGIVPWTISANVCRQFNRFEEQLSRTSGALLVLVPDTWSLCLWDGAGRVRYVRARWRAEGETYAEIALEVERSILAYVHNQTDKTVARVYLIGGGESAAMATALNQHLREPCKILPVESRLAVSAETMAKVKSATASFAAALER